MDLEVLSRFHPLHAGVFIIPELQSLLRTVKPANEQFRLQHGQIVEIENSLLLNQEPQGNRLTPFKASKTAPPLCGERRRYRPTLGTPFDASYTAPPLDTMHSSYVDTVYEPRVHTPSQISSIEPPKQYASFFALEDCQERSSGTSFEEDGELTESESLDCESVASDKLMSPANGYSEQISSEDVVSVQEIDEKLPVWQRMKSPNLSSEPTSKLVSASSLHKSLNQQPFDLLPSLRAEHVSNMREIQQRFSLWQQTQSGQLLSKPLAALPRSSAATVSRVRALRDFDPLTPRHLQFKDGDIIEVVRAVYEDRWEGYLSGQNGIFPTSHVEKFPDLGRAIALSDFVPGMPDELRFRKGDIIIILEPIYKDLWKGSLRDRIGLFHSDYVEKLPELGRVKALYDYTPRETGELFFSKDDLITVIESKDEGWWTGMLRGQIGIFPTNYVEHVLESEGACSQAETVEHEEVNSHGATDMQETVEPHEQTDPVPHSASSSRLDEKQPDTAQESVQSNIKMEKKGSMKKWYRQLGSLVVSVKRRL